MVSPTSVILKKEERWPYKRKCLKRAMLQSCNGVSFLTNSLPESYIKLLTSISIVTVIYFTTSRHPLWSIPCAVSALTLHTLCHIDYPHTYVTHHHKICHNSPEHFVKYSSITCLTALENKDTFKRNIDFFSWVRKNCEVMWRATL